MNIPIMPIAICTISSACGWYMNVPERCNSNSYRKVLPGAIGGCVSPATPSIPDGSRMPCQWIVVTSGSLLVTKILIRSPSTASIVGPGLAPL